MSETAAPPMTEAVRALGTESAFTVMARAAALAGAGTDIINLGIGQPDFPPPPHVVEAAVKALRDGHHGYTAANGIPELREAVARDLARRRGIEADPANVLIVPGGKTTMFFAIIMFGEPGAEIMYPDPGFPIYGNLIRYTGATGVPMRLDPAHQFSFSAREVLAKITPKTRLIVLNSPANPTGGVVPAAEMTGLIAGLKRHPHVYVLSDEIYARMVYDGHLHVSPFDDPDLRERVILLDGWSKTFAMTGWRLGYGIWPRNLIDTATKLAINSHSCVNAAAQHAGIAALDGPQDAVEAMIAAFARRRRIVVDGLNALPGVICAEPGGAFYAFPDISRTGLDAVGFQDRMLEDAGVATIAGTSFGPAGGRHVRVSYANSEANIVRALERIDANLRRRAGA